MVTRWRPNEYHESLIKLYNIPWHGQDDPREIRPIFGSTHLPLLNQVEASSDGLYAPTTSAFVQHFSLMQEAMDDPAYWAILQQKPRELRKSKMGACQEFYTKILEPVRVQLEQRRFIYLYNSPEVKVETNQKTGIPSIKAHGIQILKALPMSVQVAESYGVSKHDIQELAPEVIYVLDKKKCAYRTVREERQLIRLLDGWMQFVNDSRVRDQLHKSFKKSVPCIVTKRIGQLMLNM